MKFFVERKEVNQKKAQRKLAPCTDVQGVFIGGFMRLVYLSGAFYESFPRNDYPEMLHKEERPYICITVEVDNREYALPIRHHITHRHAFSTIGERGIDYTKAVVIESEDYIAGDAPIIDTVEWRKIQMNERAIIVGFTKYLKEYRRALSRKDKLKDDIILRYSALQYFDLK